MTKTRRYLHQTPDRKTGEKSDQALKKSMKKKPANKWSEQEYTTLISLVRQNGEDWNKISTKLDNKTAKQCMQKFKNSQRSAKKGNWTSQEDDLLFLWVDQHGPTKWTECSKEIKGRCGKQCRERWVNILNPNVKKGNWSDHEQDVIFNNLSTYNTSWSAMSHILPGRTENSIKNYFYSSVRRLKSNPLIHMVRNIYVHKKANAKQLFDSNQNLHNDISKLNRLSQKICLFLFEQTDKNEAFLGFLLSVLFGPDTHLPIESELKKVEPCHNFGFSGPKNLFVPCEKLDTSSSHKNQTFMDPRTVLEAMRLLEANPEFARLAPFLKMVENELPNAQIIQSGKKTEVRMTTCWNCKTDVCAKHSQSDANK